MTNYEKIVEIIKNDSPEIAANEIFCNFCIISLSIEDNEIRRKAIEFDEKDFSKWMWEITRKQNEYR